MLLGLQRALLHVQGREAGAGAAGGVLYRGEARQTLPPIQEWRRFDAADVQPGLFWCEEEREVLQGAGAYRGQRLAGLAHEIF